MRRMSGVVVGGSAVTLIFLAARLGVFALNTAKADDGKMLTVEAALNLRAVGDLQFSGDPWVSSRASGERLAFVVTEPAKGTGRLRHIWVYDKASGVARQFTFSGKSESSPRWSPEASVSPASADRLATGGSQLAFLSNREEEQQQIYLMSMEGGEARAITKGKRSVKAFEWSPNGREIALLAPDAKTEEEEKKEKDKDDAKVVDKDEKHARLWILNVTTGETRAVTKPNWEISELAWLPSGDHVVVQATDHPESDQYTERIFSVQVADGAMKELVKPQGPFGGLRVAPGGRTISFVGSREDGPEPHDLLLLPVASHAARNLTGLSLDRPVEDYHWAKDGSVVVEAANGFGNLLVTYSADGARHDLTPTPGPGGSMALAGDGEIAFVSQGAARPQEVWLWDQKEAPRQITHLNDAWKQYALSEPELYKYKSFDGMEIEAALLRPRGSPSANTEIGVHGRGAEGKAKLPLIVLIHGGPTGRWGESIEAWGQLLVTHGYAVLYPNIRGSVGYGQKFVESNRGDWGGGDFKDVMAGVEDLVKRGIADPERLGIGGWSYGGYMAEWAITQTNVFKAAVSGAGMANLISEFGTEDHPAGDEWFYGVPWEKPEGFLNSSPFVHLKNAKTPTLVLQGDADTIDPLGQSEELYRGLKRYGVETELVVYPREPHGFHEERHLVDRLNRILAWYDKYLKK